MQRDKRGGFIFYASFLEAVKELPSEVREETILTILEYGISGIELEPSNPITKAIFMLVKPQIDANYKRYENGKKGGESGGRPPKITQDKPKTTPKEKEEVKENLEERKENFRLSLVEYVDEYGKDMVREFFDYWSEPNKSKKKMRFEGEKYFHIGRRLGTWRQNNSKFKKPETPIEGGKGFIAGLNAAAQMRMPEN